MISAEALLGVNQIRLFASACRATGNGTRVWGAVAAKRRSYSAQPAHNPRASTTLAAVDERVAEIGLRRTLSGRASASSMRPKRHAVRRRSGNRQYRAAVPTRSKLASALPDNLFEPQQTQVVVDWRNPV
jgi:hypothetical protein